MVLLEKKFQIRQEDLIAPNVLFTPNKSYSAFCPFNFGGKDFSFLEIEGTNVKNDKEKCMLEYDAIDVDAHINCCMQRDGAIICEECQKRVRFWYCKI